MNSAVITKIEYRLIESQEFTELKNILYSGRPTEQVDRTRAGNLHKTSVPFKIAKVSADNDLLLQPILNRKSQFRLTDGNGAVHLVGSDQFPARLTYTKSLEGSPGSFNGYNCTITCLSPEGSVVS